MIEQFHREKTRTDSCDREEKEREEREDERRRGRDEANEIDAFIRRADP